VESQDQEKEKTHGNRDILKQVRYKINFIETEKNGQRIIFVHVHSHQKEAKTHSDPKRIERIEKQKQKLGNDKLYQILVNGNEIADILAEKGRTSAEHRHQNKIRK
jgi:hypothetical protein